MLPLIYYLDLLLVINWGINFIILLITGWIGALPFSLKRYGVASFTGTLVWLIVFFTPQYIFISWLCPLIGGVVLSLIAWPGEGWRRLLSKGALLIVAGQLTGGVIYSLAYFIDTVPLNGEGFPFAVILGGSGAILPIALLLTGRMHRTKALRSYLGKVEISWSGKTLSVPALLDSGNTLSNPLNHWPVVILEQNAALGFLEGAVLSWLKEPENAPPVELETRTALIPYTSLGGKGLLGAIRPDNLVISSSEGCLTLTQVYLALHKGVPAREYKAIAFPIKYLEEGCVE